MTDLIAWVNERMQNRHMTNKELADMTDSNEQQISLWRRGKTKPRWEQMVKLVEAFGYHFEIVANDEKAKQDMDLYETAFMQGFEQGKQMMLKDSIKMLKDSIKMLKGMKWYGGSKQAQRAEGVPGVRTGSVEADE